MYWGQLGDVITFLPLSYVALQAVAADEFVHCAEGVCLFVRVAPAIFWQMRFLT